MHSYIGMFFLVKYVLINHELEIRKKNHRNGPEKLEVMEIHSEEMQHVLTLPLILPDLR